MTDLGLEIFQMITDRSLHIVLRRYNFPYYVTKSVSFLTTIELFSLRFNGQTDGSMDRRMVRGMSQKVTVKPRDITRILNI